MIKKYLNFSFISFVFVLLLSFQNCGDVSVVTQPSAPVVPLSTFNISGNICSEVGAESSSPLKILFLVDMSLSNLGGKITRQSGNAYNHYLCQNILNNNPNDPALQALCSVPELTPTDPSGIRFQAIGNFLNADSACARLSTSAQIEYGVVGFGTDTLFPAGFTQTCESPFQSNENQVRQMINGLLQIQNQDLARPSPFAGGAGTPYAMGSTNYLKGLSCMYEKLTTDALLDREILPFYYNVFLSDGAATDNEDLCSVCTSNPTGQSCRACLTQNNCDLVTRSCARAVMIPKVIEKTKNEIAPFSAGFKFQPVYYNGQSLGSDFGAAEPLLNAMAQAGGVSGPIRLSSNNEMILLQERVCSSIEKSLKTKHRVSDAFIVNLTARMTKGVLKADSDMDGLIDEVEINTNPIEPRSNGKILDSICKKDETFCQQSPTCVVQNNVGFGFTNCELEYMRNASLTNSLVDTNQNGINDFIEILKGGNAYSLIDATSDLDDDGLGYFYEIANGYDVNNSDTLFNPSTRDLVSARISATRPIANVSCPANEELFSISISSLPLVKTKKYTDKVVGPLNLSHEENENVFAVLYSSQELGGLPNAQKKYFVYLFKMKYGQSRIDLSIKPIDFIEFSEVLR